MPNRPDSSFETPVEKQATPAVFSSNVSTTVSIGAMHSAALPLFSGNRFSRYEIIEYIGGGGMGLVFKARDPLLERIVALKTIRSGVLAGPTEIERFLQEAKAIAQVDHPNIVAIYEIGQDQGQYFFTMQLATGGTLAQKVSEFAQGHPRSAAALMEKIARAVEFAHQHNILHRDLKPGNILLDQAGEPLVGDFGLAKFLDADTETTQDGQALGSPPYMSPEQASGNVRQITAQSDIWALGVMLYELTTGQRPFSAANKDELKQQICQLAVPRPSSLRRDIDKELETIILKCLEGNPANRYLSAGELADELRRWLDGVPIKARPLSPPQRLWRTLRRHRGKAAIGLFLLLAVLIAAFALMPADPNRWSATLEHKLQQKQAVTLIGPTGGPAGFRWVMGENKSSVALAEQQPFFVQSADHALLELASSAKMEQYRLRAEILHDSSQWNGDVGIYVAHQVQPVSAGPAHIYSKLAFNDHIRGPRWNRVTLSVPIIAGVNPTLTHNLYSRDGIPFTPSPAGEKKWRALAIEVTAHDARVFWDGQQVDQATWDEAPKQWRFLMKAPLPAMKPVQDLLGELDLTIKPTGGLGLVVHQASAYFRNVVVEPLALER